MVRANVLHVYVYVCIYVCIHVCGKSPDGKKKKQRLNHKSQQPDPGQHNTTLRREKFSEQRTESCRHGMHMAVLFFSPFAQYSSSQPTNSTYLILLPDLKILKWEVAYANKNNNRLNRYPAKEGNPRSPTRCDAMRDLGFGVTQKRRSWCYTDHTRSSRCDDAGFCWVGGFLAKERVLASFTRLLVGAVYC